MSINWQKSDQNCQIWSHWWTYISMFLRKKVNVSTFLRPKFPCVYPVVKFSKWLSQKVSTERFKKATLTKLFLFLANIFTPWKVHFQTWIFGQCLLLELFKSILYYVYLSLIWTAGIPTVYQFDHAQTTWPHWFFVYFVSFKW